MWTGHRFAGFAPVLLLIAFSAVHAAEAPVLSGAGHNEAWSVGPDGRSAQIKGSAMERPTISFAVAQLQRAPLAIVANSDTAKVTVSVGEFSRTFETTGGDQTLVMDAGREAVLAFNGKADAAWQGPWAENLKRDDQVTVEFAPCLFVKLSWQHGGNVSIPEVTGEAATEDEADDDRDDRRRRRWRDRREIDVEPPDVRRISGSIVQLRIHRGERGVVGLAPAVVVRRGGLAVAPLHALVGATQVEAHVYDRAVKERLPVSVVGFDKATDLAVVRLDVSAAPTARAALTPLTAAAKAPEEDAPLWVAHRVGDRMRLSGGTVKWAGVLGELGSRSREKLGYPETTQWLLIDAESDRGYAMRPIVDKDGALVGLGAWTWPMSGEVVAALDVGHVEKLINTSDTARSVAWGTLSEEAAGQRWPYATYPEVAVEGTAAVADLRRAVAVAERSHTCPRCDGKGYVLRRVTLGYEVGAGMRRPVRTDKALECPRCEGNGLHDQEPMLAGFGTLAEAVAKLDMDEAGAQAQIERAAEALTAIARSNFRSLVRISDQQAADLIAGGPGSIGKPIVLFGEKVRVGRRSELGGEAGLQAVRIVDPTESRRSYGRDRNDQQPQHAVIIDGVRHGPEGRGELAVVSGVVAGYVAREQGESPLIVVTGAMVLSIDEDDLVERQTAEEWNEENLPEVDERR